MKRSILLLLVVFAGCDRLELPVLRSLPEVSGTGATASARINGPVGRTDALAGPQVSLGQGRTITLPAAAAAGPGDISFNFADTDIREVVAQILGNTLRVNYSIDPAVRGAATLRTTTPLARSQVLPALNALLAQNGAAIVETAGLYRVVPAAAAAGAGLAGGVDVSGSGIIPLRYASAEDLAKLLQPYAGAGGKIIADPGRNALLISGDPPTRDALAALVEAFDINALAGQSYALFPVSSGGAKDFATALSDAFRSGAGGSLAGVVRVVPMERINSVLLVSSQPRYIDEARRVYTLIDRQRRQTSRSWNVYYLQNSRSNDIAYVLQQAFTPNNVTAVPTPRTVGGTAPGRGSQRSSGFNQNNPGASGGIGGAAGGGAAGVSGGLGQPSQGAGVQAPPIDPSQNPANPLLGGLDPTGGSSTTQDNTNSIRIIPNIQNNALLIYGTAQEKDTVEAMLRKIDILPLQVRIDATIAEVTLNDNLSYGTQFFFKAGGINGALNFSPAGTAANTFLSAFPGFVLSGPNNGNGALSALQAVTTVKVLSSPQVLVLDNEAARLQVGNLVPYLTSSSQSVVSSGSPIINSIDYRETGVIMEVTPRVNSGGLVTLDISQEVSDVDTTAITTNSIQSPTFLERKVSSRVVVQDGQTIGLAGLIRDNSSRTNSGIPWLKDVPLLGLLAGQQANERGRTELLVLITPHVVHDQRDARALTEDLRDQLINAASVPDDLRRERRSGSPDPQRRVRHNLRLDN
jgi:general secretion pathway protein D